jgi:hypothetical protein
MKQAELAQALDKGEIIMKGIYWTGEVQTITMRDGQSGKRREAHVVRETVMRDKGSTVVSRFMGDDEDFTAWKPSAKKMETVIVRITGMSVDKGNVTLNGVVEPLV